MIYIASPYYHQDQEVIQKRMEAVYAAMYELMSEGYHPITPMSMHEVVNRFALPKDFEFWKDYSIKLLSKCNMMYVITSDGWKESKGVMAEIEYCTRNRIDIVYVDPTELKYNYME